jgi:hypothetical protein
MSLIGVILFEPDAILRSLRRSNISVAALAVLLAGCDHAPKLRPGWAIVSGTVTYQGKPLPGGEVMWCTTKDGAAIVRGGPIGQDGTFMLDTPTGPATIAIHVSDLKKSQPSRYVDIPSKYTLVEKSGLTYEAKDGANKGVTFKLE